jgi:hypothetical protein
MKIPIYIQRRQFSLRTYVYDSLFPSDKTKVLFNKKTAEEKASIKKKMKNIVDECSYLCFIFSIKQLFMEGTKAAENAVDTFKELGIKEFSIGKKLFRGRNKNVLEGKMLYEKMVFSIKDPNLKKIIEQTNNFYEIINRYKDVSI